ncbi:hypothetical protein [Nonomuraea glycinis]|uniref:hypothetical protein n=1 Tax=Nonomuraea glycinis TaxID=2047744 RepID=UPI0033A0742A
MPADLRPMDTPDTLTVICAYDNAETQHVRSQLDARGMRGGQVIEAADPARLAGICVLHLRIVETPSFARRPDAPAIRKALQTVEQVCRNVSRVTPEEYDAWHPAPLATRPERVFTRDQLAELLDSGRPAADAITRGMHLGFHDHPVVREILARRRAAHEAFIPDGQGETIEQVISEDQARALVTHIERMEEELTIRRNPALELPPILGPIEPGAHLVTVYGVRVIVENRAPVLAEQRGNAGHTTLGDILRHAVPAGTRPHEAHRILIPTAGDDEPMRQYIERETRRSLARMRLGEPHVLVYLTRDDLPGLWPGDPLHAAFFSGMMLVIGVTVRAIPGALDHIVLRPAPGAPPLPHPHNGRWLARPKHTSGDGIRLAQATTESVTITSGYATGRIEVNGDGALAEVFEVTP